MACIPSSVDHEAGSSLRKIPHASINGASSPHARTKVTNVLFVCSANRLRSPTAEQVFSTWQGIETDSAGISNGAAVLLSVEQVEWADIIFVMEKTHRNKLNREIPLQPEWQKGRLPRRSRRI